MSKQPLIICFVAAILIATMLGPAPMYSAQASNVKSSSVAIPVSMGLVGSGNATKTFLLDLPIGVTASSIKTSTMKYSGNNTAIDSIGIENGKIKVKLKGNEKVESYPVKGVDGKYKDPFFSYPGNSIWRYADGRRWQINDYDENQGVNTSYNVNATDSQTPSGAPPKKVVTTKSEPVDPSTATWYKDEANRVDYNSVIPSSIKPVPLVLDGDPGTVSVKDGKFIVTYTVPSKRKLPEAVPDSFEKGEWVEGRLYYVRLPYYFTANSKVTSYSYAGTVSFDYTIPTEPTLDGSVIVVKPNPNPTKADGSDVAVTLKVTGDLTAYMDSSNIQEWIFYAKESGSSDAKTKKDYTKALNSSQSFDNFIIPKARITKDDFEQEYTLTVTVRFSKPVLTSGGSITSLTKTMKATVGVYKTPPIIADPPSSGGNKPPVAVLDTWDEVLAGEEFWVNGSGSYDPDGTIVEYKYTASGTVFPITGKEGWTWYPISKMGRHSIVLRVKDNDGLSGTTSAKLNVIAPTPEAKIEIAGTKKENRKVILVNKSRSPEHYPLDESKTRFSIEPVSGGTAADIKYSGSLTVPEDKEVLFKKAGTYKATIYVENIAGYSNTDSVTFDVVPDEAPTAYISVPSKIYRDPDNGNKASAALIDMSFSPDYDYIAHRLWQYRYDSDNDGSFDDESWGTISDANENQLNFTPSQVGYYEIKLTVTEEFDQPTIDEFVKAADRRADNTDWQNAIEKVVTVYNRAPVVDWSW